MIRAAFLMALMACPAQAEQAKIIKVLDGDTYVIAAPWLPPELGTTLSVRVLGIDTPEHGWRAKCQQEATLADQATAFAVAQIAAASRVEVVFRQWDKFGGRIDGDVLLDGQSIGRKLIAAGLARAYWGDAKQSWCN